ncbi:MAG: M13 family metallopeptidase, partial [Methanospirillum sp.]|nr:M13 family metallopeptidase [Methanospirillum sp.]
MYPAIVVTAFILALIGIPAGADLVSPDIPPGMNTSLDPGDDFFSYANDHWIRDNPVPSGKTFYSAFEEVEGLVDDRVRVLVEDASQDTNASSGSPTQILGTFYRAALNDEANAEIGLTPVRDELDMITNISDRSGIREVTSNLTAHGLDPFFVLYIDENPENRTQLIATIDSGDLTLRYPPFYMFSVDESARVQDEMKKYVTSTFERQGADAESAGEIADTVFRIEKRLAESELITNESNGSEENLTAGTYQVRDLNTIFPGINWESLFADAGRPDIQEVYIMNPNYVREVGRIVSTEPVPDLQSFLTWRLLQFVAPFATPDMQEAYYRFYESDLSKRELTSQKDRIFDVMDLYLGNPIAHLYVNHYFSGDDRDKVEDIIKNMREVMRERVENLTWMSPETKKTALKKMDYLKEQAGYPDTWGEFHNLTLTDRSYLENMLSITSYFTNGSLQ